MVVRAKMVSHGRVQGVFYRATVRDIARGMGITGYVRNLEDGTVEIVCECKDEDEYEQFKRAVWIREDYGIWVERIDVIEKADVTGREHDSFYIMF